MRSKRVSVEASRVINTRIERVWCEVANHAGRLPHWEARNAVYFVTFRLAGSLPNGVRRRFEFERQDIVKTAHAMGRELSVHERTRLAKLFSDEIESYLDAGSGFCVLAKPQVAEIVMRTLQYFDRVRYRVFAWCIMPNHVHVVVQPIGNFRLSGILQGWKSYSAKKANKLIGNLGAFWQREYYDHLVRSDAEFDHLVQYVLENPGKAGLESWPWVGRDFNSLPVTNGKAGETPALHKPAARNISACARS